MNINPLNKIMQAHIRTGTKFAIAYSLVSLIIVIFLNIVYPIVGLWVPELSGIIKHLGVSNTTVALIGSSALSFGVNEIRKAIENRGKENGKTENKS